MTTITRTVTMLRSGVAFSALRQYLIQRRDAALADLTRRVLAVPAVQREVARAFEGNTPMCRVLSDAIESQLTSIDAENISGLEREIEQTVETVVAEAMNTLEAENIQGLEAFVENIVEEQLKEDDIANSVIETLIDRLRR